MYIVRQGTRSSCESHVIVPQWRSSDSNSNQGVFAPHWRCEPQRTGMTRVISGVFAQIHCMGSAPTSSAGNICAHPVSICCAVRLSECGVRHWHIERSQLTKRRTVHNELHRTFHKLRSLKNRIFGPALPPNRSYWTRSARLRSLSPPRLHCSRWT